MIIHKKKTISNTEDIKRDSEPEGLLYRKMVENLPDIALFLFDNEMRNVIISGQEVRKNPSLLSVRAGEKITDAGSSVLSTILVPMYEQALKNNTMTTERQIGDSFYYIQTIPFNDIEKSGLAGMAIFQNITHEKDTEEKIIQEKEYAEHANKAKSYFIAKISHEIRTPLNSIIGFLEQINYRNTTADTREKLEIIRKSSLHLQQIVSETLRINEIESGRISVEEVVFSPVEVINEVVDMLKPLANQKKLDFKTHIDKTVRFKFIGDKSIIKQILINLSTNAIKFTHKGWVKIDVAMDKIADIAFMVRFSVLDSGIGIPKEMQEEIFTPYVSGMDVKDGESKGLGLSISYELVNALKGAIEIESNPGYGTAISFTIPLKKAPREKSRTSIIYGTGKSRLKNANILVVDDDENSRLLLKTILTKWEIMHEAAINGEEAIKMIEESPYDLVLMDINMPVMDGISALEIIRDKKGLSPYYLPVVALTANPMQKDIDRYLQLGMNGFIVKPFSERNLIDTLSEILNKSRSVRVVQKNKQGKKNNTKPGKRYDLSSLKQMAGYDQKLIANLLQTFISSSKQERSNMRKFLAKNDRENLGKTAHKMASSFAHLDIKKETFLLKKIEHKTMQKKTMKGVRSLVEQFTHRSSQTIDALQNEYHNLKNSDHKHEKA